jgi:hypothetical protein
MIITFAARWLMWKLRQLRIDSNNEQAKALQMLYDDVTVSHIIGSNGRSWDTSLEAARKALGYPP